MDLDPGSRTAPLRRFPSVASLPSFSLQWFPCPVFFYFMMDEAVGRGWWWVGQALPRPTALVPVGLATTFRLWPRPPPVQGGRGVATALSPTPISLHYYVPCG